MSVAADPVRKMPRVKHHPPNNLGDIALGIEVRGIWRKMRCDIARETSRYYAPLLKQMHEHPYHGHVVWIAIRLSPVSTTATAMLAEPLDYRIVDVRQCDLAEL